MCDTFVALSSATQDGSVVFGKNSDREPNEAQVLEYHPARTWSADGKETVECTYISVPQAKETHPVLLSRPFWMWGAEMGANNKGVVIGNEAVFTKMPYRKTGCLTGMDLLRLALERSSTAEEGLETIVRFLSDFGQGGSGGYEDKKMVYHNSYIIADRNDAWVLETAGHLWAALKVKDVYSISNGLTIGEEFDRSHPDLIDTARKNGWLKKGKSFNFARCFSDWFYTTFSFSRQRRRCSFDRVGNLRGKITVGEAFGVLRTHRREPYRPNSHFFMDNVCMHAGNALSRNSGTTGSLVAHLQEDADTFWVTGTSAPCTSIFKPVWFEEDVLPDMGPVPDGSYNPDSLWWRHEYLHRRVLADYSRIELYRKDRDLLEKSFLQEAYETGSEHRSETSRQAFARSREATEAWIERIESQATKSQAIVSPTGLLFDRFWNKQNQKSGMQ
ncbi:MAG: peptidase U34 [Proteobacteria bacterium]|nr:peptidase U34 [Pseudomonadota bacterium]